MSVLDKIVALWTTKGSRGKRLYIIDAAHLFSGGRGHGRLSPRDQVQALQKLSRFAEKEGIRVQAVFEGKPLREVDHGGDFNGVKVFFADKGDKLPDLVLNIYRKGRRNSPVVVTSNRDIEDAVRGAGGATIRSQTFRKGMDNGSSGGSGRSEGARGRGRQRPRSRGQRRRPKQDQPQPQKQRSEGGKGSEEQAVRDLIDLVE